MPNTRYPAAPYSLYCLRHVSAEEPKPCTMTMTGALLDESPALPYRMLCPRHSHVPVLSAPYTGTSVLLQVTRQVPPHRRRTPFSLMRRIEGGGLAGLLNASD